MTSATDTTHHDIAELAPQHDEAFWSDIAEAIEAAEAGDEA